MKSRNKILNEAKINPKDEFYTQMSDIELELQHYKEQFKNKIVYCNCDNPETSNFWKYFLSNFEKLGLKKLISTYINHNGRSFVRIATSGGKQVKDVKLLCNGDFRSDECVNLLKQADIIVTNPPFSLFRDYIKLVMQYDKKFIIWGNLNAVVYKEFFPYIQSGDIWLGSIVNKSCHFEIPKDYEKYDIKYTDLMNNGKKYAKVASITVFTNLKLSKDYSDFVLKSRYDEVRHKKYDNYNAINVDKVVDIPIDYYGVIGVPITMLGRYHPRSNKGSTLSEGYLSGDLSVHFDIVGIACGNSWVNYRETLVSLGFKPEMKYGGGLGIGIIDGKPKYSRIFIKRKNGENK